MTSGIFINDNIICPLSRGPKRNYYSILQKEKSGLWEDALTHLVLFLLTSAPPNCVIWSQRVKFSLSPHPCSLNSGGTEQGEIPGSKQEVVSRPLLDP